MEYLVPDFGDSARNSTGGKRPPPASNDAETSAETSADTASAGTASGEGHTAKRPRQEEEEGKPNSDAPKDNGDDEDDEDVEPTL